MRSSSERANAWIYSIELGCLAAWLLGIALTFLLPLLKGVANNLEGNSVYFSLLSCQASHGVMRLRTGVFCDSIALTAHPDLPGATGDFTRQCERCQDDE